MIQYIFAAILGGGVAYAQKKKMFAKGGKTPSKKLKYTAKADLGTLTIKHDGKEIEIAPKDYLNGSYKFAKGGTLSDKYEYIKKYDVVSIEKKDGGDMKPINGFWVKKSALDSPTPAKKETKAKETPKKASKSTKRVSVPRPIKYDKQDPSKSEAFMKVIGAFTGKDWLRNAEQYINVDERITATDGHLLASFPNPVGKSDSELICPPSKKCDPIDEDDSRQKFPNYKPIVRFGQDEGLLGAIKDVSEVYKELKSYVNSNKYVTIDGKRKTAYNQFNVLLDFDDMSGNKALMNMEFFLKVLKACLQLGWYKISLGQSGKNKAIFVTDNNPRKSKEEGGVFLIMPLYDDGRYESYEAMDGPNNSIMKFTKSGDFESLEEMPKHKSKFKDGGVTEDEGEQLDLPFKK